MSIPRKPVSALRQRHTSKRPCLSRDSSRDSSAQNHAGYSFELRQSLRQRPCCLSFCLTPIPMGETVRQAIHRCCRVATASFQKSLKRANQSEVGPDAHKQRDARNHRAIDRPASRPTSCFRRYLRGNGLPSHEVVLDRVLGNLALSFLLGQPRTDLCSVPKLTRDHRDLAKVLDGLFPSPLKVPDPRFDEIGCCEVCHKRSLEVPSSPSTASSRGAASFSDRFLLETSRLTAFLLLQLEKSRCQDLANPPTSC